MLLFLLLMLVPVVVMVAVTLVAVVEASSKGKAKASSQGASSYFSTSRPIASQSLSLDRELPVLDTNAIMPWVSVQNKNKGAAPPPQCVPQ